MRFIFVPCTPGVYSTYIAHGFMCVVWFSLELHEEEATQA